MSILVEAVFGGFISKVINDVGDVTKEKIIDAIKNKNSKHQSLESQIYNIVVDVLNKISYGKYENDQDKIYNAAEKILKGFNGCISDYKDNIKSGLNVICKNVDNNRCTDFIEVLYQELSQDKYSELYREIRLLQQEKEDNKTSRIEQKVDIAIQKIDNIKNDSKEIYARSKEEKFQNNKKEDYLKVWHSRLFLHVDNDERPITLEDAFIMPRCDSNLELNKRDILTQTVNDKKVETFSKKQEDNEPIIFENETIKKILMLMLFSEEKKETKPPCPHIWHHHK